jgi:hypothetical protein
MTSYTATTATDATALTATATLTTISASSGGAAIGYSATTFSTGSASAGVPASLGAFAGLGTSRTSLPGPGFDPTRLLPPPAPMVGSSTLFDVSGRVVGSDGQVAAAYAVSTVAW